MTEGGNRKWEMKTEDRVSGVRFQVSRNGSQKPEEKRITTERHGTTRKDKAERIEQRAGFEEYGFRFQPNRWPLT
jgi:hypothetical protein